MGYVCEKLVGLGPLVWEEIENGQTVHKPKLKCIYTRWLLRYAPRFHRKKSKKKFKKNYYYYFFFFLIQKRFQKKIRGSRPAGLGGDRECTRTDST
jgi:hypothetical protein